MFWMIAVSALVGMILGTFLGILVMSLMFVASRESKVVRVDDWT
jgi:hypothetical protein